MSYKMLMIIMDEKLSDEVEIVLERHHVDGFSEIPSVLGEGRSGKKLDSRLHPGANSIILSVVEASTAQEIKDDLLQTCRGVLDDESNTLKIHIAIIAIEEFV